MELAQLIKERRSVHLFEDRPVSIELVKELLDTAVWVPNHRMTQPWRFVLVHGEGRKRLADAVRTGAESRERDPEKKQEVGERLYNRFMSIPLFVAVVMSENPNPAVREEDYASTCCIIHNFSLLAWEHQIGMVWETYPMLSAPEFRAALGVGPGERIIGNLHVGYSAKVPAAKSRIPAEQLLTIIDQA